ncbi:MAG: SRPBCC family protein [Myxococcota bacterium]
MREHRYSFDMPHSAARIWALMKESALCFSVPPGHDRWTEYSPVVTDIEVVDPGDEHGNGLRRRLGFKLSRGRRGVANELVTDVEPERSYIFHMGKQTGKVTLEPLGPNRTRLHFEERFHIEKAPRKWFEGLIYRSINRKNEASLRGFSQWLTDHPEYRADLVEEEEVAASAGATA